MGSSIVAFILVNTEIGSEHEVAEKIRRLKGVEEALVTYGEYDVVVKVRVSSIRELDEVVTSIRRIEGVRLTSTLIAT